MFFGFFASKKPLQELDDINLNLNKIYDPSNKKDKSLIDKFHTLLEKLAKLLISDDKLTFNDENKKSEIIEFFLKNKIMNNLTSYAIKDSPEGTIDYLLKFIIHIIRELKSKFILSDLSVIESITNLLNFLKILIEKEKLRYITRILSIHFLSELCKKFFYYPEILKNMKIKITEETEEKNIINEYEDILVFSLLINIFKTDQLILEYENKKLIRRAIIICLSFEEVSESSYIENDSIFSEILIEKLCNYYQMLPEYFELSEELNDITLEVAPNMKKTFNVLVNTYLEFRDYIFFLNKLFNTIRSVKLREKFRILLFNKFLIGNLQDKILSSDLRIIRSNLQYFIFILKTIKNSDFVNLFFNFIFGFSEKNSRIIHSTDVVKQLLNNENNENKINLEISTNDITNQSNYFNSNYKISESDFDYQKHKSVAIGLAILNNLNNNKENLNIIIFTLYETFFEKCPFNTIHKIILPFTEFCLKQMEDTSYLLQNKKNYPDITLFFKFISKINEDKIFNFGNIADYLENNLNKSYQFYINSDIDFYYYYLNQRGDIENFKYIDEEENEESFLEKSMNRGFISPQKNNYNKNIIYEEKLNLEEIQSKNENENILFSELRTSLSNIQPKFNFDYFASNTKQKINLKSKLFDELAEIEEEFNNIHILFMKKVLEKFANFMNNTHFENIFITNLIITIFTIPCLEFDPVLVLCQSLLLDENHKSNFSILNHCKYLIQEIENILNNPDNKNLINIIKQRKEEKENNKKVDKSKKNNIKNNDENFNMANNILIFTEFLKDFISIIIHKFQFEMLVENTYELYSKMLDEYYVNNSNEDDETNENNLNDNLDENNRTEYIVDKLEETENINDREDEENIEKLIIGEELV